MNWLVLTYNILLQAGAVWALLALVRLVQEYRLAFMRPFLVFVAGFNLFGFVIFFLQDVMVPLVGAGGERIELTLVILMVFLVMPVTMVTIYFLVRAALVLVELSVPRWFHYIYWIISLFFMVLTALAVEFFLRTGINDYLSAVYSFGFMVFNQLVIYLSMGYAHYRARRIMDGGRRRSLALGTIRILWIAFAWYYLLLTVFSDIPWVFWTLGVWFYLVVILPVVYLRIQLPREFSDLRIVPSQVRDIKSRGAGLGLSHREVEIVTLVLAGKSNRDIEDELFIAQRTVKNHLYNIYRKLKVKNRVGLLRIFLDS